MSEDVIKHSVHTLVFRSLKRSHDMFLANQGMLPPIDDKAEKVLKLVKARDSYGQVMGAVRKAQALKQQESVTCRPETPLTTAETVETAPLPSEGAVVPYSGPTPSPSPAPPSGALTVPRKPPSMPKPKWHPPWKLMRVISGHLGWVRCVAVEPGNEWFATGAADRVIKVWDLASGKLKVSLTGHVSTVRGVVVSPRHPYLFSCGEDRQVKCWDLEYNKVIRQYHGHLSAVVCLALHPRLDVLVSAGRDGTARVWDVRSKANVHTLAAHTDTVASLACQAAEPQIITGSHDSTIRLWDLAAGKSVCTLTNHKKSVRAIVIHPTMYTFASASPDNIKQWKCPEGKFIQNLSGHNAIVNCLAVNPEGVLVSGGDNGTMYCWDWRTGYNFQRLQTAVQPGSMDSEAGIFAMSFDQSGSRLITAEADKTIKIYKEDEAASEETHPVNWRPELLKRRKF
ncbi:pleiotropic regulator 1 isoform X1 [Bombyx mandarina]|uniref:Pleiotropic regulator 1 n=1 Tax=Bombyx mandarina TaxID=7092 RepID=A0A6J2JZZ1_BOMMA|nr:pleiotropic regulator 1 isoform X1 [Bombyx mandarina]